MRRVEDMNYRCPCCQRPLEKMLDYPLVFVRKVEILSIPEVMDYSSEEAARAWLKLAQPSDDKPPNLSMAGINRTPEVASAYESEVVQNFFVTLKNHEGQEMVPTLLAPPLEPDKYFRWSYPIPGTRLYVSLSEAKPEKGERICRVVLHGKGPNLGSAGGPTLQPFGVIAAIRYEGRLLWSGNRDPVGGHRDEPG